VERYRPRIFGFPTHETAKLHRWQEAQRDAQIERLERAEARSALASAAPGAGVGAGAPAVPVGLAALD
jgi:casein kinase II subunit beta